MLLRCNIAKRSGVPMLAIALIAAVLSGTPLLAEQGYLQEVSDMPLPAGFIENTASGVAFDKPEGRIVETEAIGSMARRDVVAFYRRTLPQLGWQATGAPDALAWRRDGEALRLDIGARAGGTVIRFHITPQ